MISFKQFLLEGGAATAKYDTQRANQADIQKALKFVSKTLDVPYETLVNDLIGSTRLTLEGKKKDSGDVDIAVNSDEMSAEEVDKKMLAATHGEGKYNPGTKTGSYAVPVNNSKKIQVDLMFIKNKEWAKFMYHSSEGDGSKYPGAVRNIILMTALAHSQEPGKDFVLRDDNGKAVVRASKSMKFDTGMERLFKMASYNTKTGKYGSTLNKVSPEEIEQHLKAIGKEIKFSHDPEISDTPDHVAAYVFGPRVKAKDLMTAENVIKNVRKMKNAEEVINACKSELNRSKLPVPTEL